MRSTSGSRTCSIIARMRAAPRPRVEIGVDAQHLVDLAADRDHRIERRHRLLKDHRHGGGAQLPQPAVAGGEQFLADQFDAAAGRHQRALLQQSHHGQRRDGFSRTAFADQAQGFALAHLQRDAVDDARCRGLPRPTTRLSMSRTSASCHASLREQLCHRSCEPNNHPGEDGFVACPAMTVRNDARCLICRPRAASCGDRARRARRRRSD